MYKLLIADDEKIIRESVKDVIPWKELDIEICACCKNGLEALDAILDTAPDIVMTDIRMPGISGLELIERIQKFDSHIQFIILTGYPEFEYAQQAIRYGVKEYLLKPISEEAIITAVKNAKASFPLYNLSRTIQLLSSLMEARAENNPEQAEICFHHYFSHFHTAEDLRSVGIDLFIRLHTYFENFSPEALTLFSKDMLLLPNLPDLQAKIQTEIMKLLFTDHEMKTSLSDKTKAYVHEHLSDENLSLKFIAENLLYVNVNYLSRAFTRQTGEKFSAYLNRTRIEKAQKLLKGSSPNIHKIAEQVGFGSNPQYFSQVFKKYTGMTPSQYAEQGSPV